jgi:NTE family protein
MYDTLVISGGAVKGLFLLGAIQALIDAKLALNITTYVGTSVGSIIGYLLCIGYTPIEIIVYVCTHHLIEKLQSFNLVSVVNNEGGAISYHHINETLEKLTVEKIGKFVTLGELKAKYGRKLYCVTYNISTDKTEYLSWENHPDMPCLVALRLSSNIPLIFDKYKYMNSYYVDGGISDNFPVKFAESVGRKVIGLVLNEPSVPYTNQTGLIEYIFKLLQIPISQSIRYKCSLADLSKSDLFYIDGNTRKMFDFDVKQEEKIQMFSEGYQKFKRDYTEFVRVKAEVVVDCENYSVYL